MDIVLLVLLIIVIILLGVNIFISIKNKPANSLNNTDIENIERVVKSCMNQNIDRINDKLDTQVKLLKEANFSLFDKLEVKFNNLENEIESLKLSFKDTNEMINDKLKEMIKDNYESVNQIKENGIFVASIRDYDSLLMEKPPYSPPYIHKTDKGQRVSFQTWEWNDDNYKLIQYIVDDEESLQVNKFECEYRATRREEMTKIMLSCGCSKVEWKFPEETGFYQPIVVARK